MANRSEFVFGVRADTTSATKDLSTLQKSLQTLQKQPYQIRIENPQITQAAESAKALESALIKATNVDTKKLDLTKFNQSLAESNTNLNTLASSLLSAGTNGQQAFSQLNQLISQAEMPVKKLNSAITTMGTTLMNTIKWQASSSLIHGLMSSISGAIGYAKNLNSTLNDIQIVTGQSSDEMARFASYANKAAKELSTSTNEFAKASLIYYQQGDSAELAAKKAAITVKAANVAFTASAQEMSEMLTSVWNAYQMGEDQLEGAVDILAKLGATTASSMEEMATGMQKVAATANNVGVSMEQMAAMVATSASVTRQAPQTIGTAWNTILSRIGGLKLGETLEDGVDLNKYSKALQSIGVDILDANGELRDMGGVVDEIGEKWEDLSSAQQSALAQTIGGARQYTQILAFFDNFDKYQKNLQTASGSKGALNEQADIYAQSWEAASKRAQAAMETLYSQLINDKSIIKLTDFFTTLLNVITKVTDQFGGMGNVLALVATKLVDSNVDTFATKLTEVGRSVAEVFNDNARVNEYTGSLQTMIDLQNNMAEREDISEALSTELRYNAEILKIKQDLAQNQSKYTADQKKEAEDMIQMLETRKQYYSEIIALEEKMGQKTKQQVANEIKESVARQNGTFSAEDLATSMGRQIARDAANAGLQNGSIFGDIQKTNEDGQAIKVTADELSETLGNLATQFGVVQNANEQLTLDTLLNTYDRVNSESKLVEDSLKSLNDTFKDGKIQATDMTDQQLIEYFTNLSTELQTSTLPELKNFGESLQETVQNPDIDSSILQEQLNRLLILLVQMQGKTNDAKTEFNDLFTGAHIDRSKVDEFGNAVEEVPKKINKMALDAGTELDNLKKSLEDKLKGATDSVKTFVSTASMLVKISSAFTAVKNAIDKLKNPDISFAEKLTTTFSTLLTVSYALSAAIQTLPKVAAAASAGLATFKAFVITTTGANFGLASSFRAVTAAMVESPFGLIALALIALAGIIVGITKDLENVKKAQEDYNKSIEKTEKAIDKSQEKEAELQTNLSDLSSIMNDTSLTYDEQIEKINEIVEAYGLQITALEILSGHYSHLQDSMKSAIIAESEQLLEEAKETYNTAKEQQESKLFVSDINGTGLKSTRYTWDGQTFETFRELQDQMFDEVMTPFYDAMGDELDNLNWDEQTAAFNKWFEQQGGLIEQYVGLEGAETDIFRYASGMSAEEGNIFDQLTDQLDNLGFEIQGNQIIDKLGEGIANYTGLYELLQSDQFEKFRSDSESYVSQLLEILGPETKNAYRAQQDYIQKSLAYDLYRNNNTDLFGTEQKDMQTTNALIESIMGEEYSSDKNRSYLLDKLSGISAYSNAVAQLQSLERLKSNYEVSNQDVNGDKLRQDLLNQITDDGALDAEVLLRITATDIEFKDNVYQISQEAKKLAQAQIDIENAQQKRELLASNEQAATRKNFTREDFEQIQSSSIFDSQDELNEFVYGSYEERMSKWAELNKQYLDKEKQGYLDLAEAANEQMNKLIGEDGQSGEFNQWLTQTFAQALNEEIKTKYGIDDNMPSNDAFLNLKDQLVNIQNKLTEQENQINLFESSKESDSWAEYEESYGTSHTDTDLKNLQKAHEELSLQKAELQELVQQGLDYDTAIKNAQDDIQIAQQGLQGIEFDEVTQQITEATDAINAFSSAIDKQGSLSALELTNLAKYAEVSTDEIINKYNTLSQAEWAKYMAENAEKYFDQLKNRSNITNAEIVDLEQQKSALVQKAYSIMATAASDAAAEIQEQWTKITTAADNVTSALSKFSDLTNMDFKSIETLKQNLIDAGMDAEHVEEVIKRITTKGDNDNENVKAAIWASTNASLNKILALESQKTAMEGIVEIKEVDVSAVTPVQLGEAESELTEEGLDTSNAENPNVGDASANLKITNKKDVDNPDLGHAHAILESADVDSSSAQSPDLGNAKAILNSSSVTQEGVKLLVCNVNLSDSDITVPETPTGLKGQINLKSTDINSPTAAKEIAGQVNLAEGDIVQMKQFYVSATGRIYQAYKAGTQTFYVPTTGNIEQIIYDKGYELSFNQGTVAKVVTVSKDGQVSTIDINTGLIEQLEPADEDTVLKTKALITEANPDIDADTLDKLQFSVDVDGHIIAVNQDNQTPFLVNTDGQIQELKPPEKPIDVNVNGNITYKVTAGGELLEDKAIEVKVQYVEDLGAQSNANWASALMYGGQSSLQGSFHYGISAEQIAELRKYNTISNDTMEQWQEAFATAAGTTPGQFLWNKWETSDILGDDYTQLLLNAFGQSLHNIDLSSVNSDVKSLINEYCSLVHDLMESSEPEVREIGYNLFNGLPVGFKNAISTHDWASDVDGEGNRIESAIADEVQTASPSKITLRIGRYVAEGLWVGLAEGLADGEVPVDGLGARIISSFERELANSEDKLKALGLKTFDIIYSNAKFDGTDQKIIDWNAMADQYATTQAFDPTSGSYSKFLEDKKKEFFDKISAAGSEYELEWLNGGYADKEKSELNDVQIALLKDALKDIGEITDRNIDEAYSIVQKALNNTYEDLTTSINDEIISMKQNWANGLEQMFTNDEAHAQKVYETWESTFEAIKKARLAAFTDDNTSIMDQLSSDVETIQTLYKTLMSQGMTGEEARTYLNNTNLTAEDLQKLSFQPFEQSGWQKAGKQEFLPWQENGSLPSNLTNDQIVNAYMQNVQSAVQERLEYMMHDQTAYQDYISSLNKAAQSSDEYEKAGALETIAQLKELGFIDVGANGSAIGLRDFSNFDEGFFGEVKETLIKSFTLTPDEILNLYVQGLAKQETSRFSVAQNANESADKLLTRYNADDEILSKARQSLLSRDGDLTKDLTEEEQERLKALTNEEDLSAIGLKQVEEASTNCASQMEKLASAIGTVMGMIERGEASGYTIDQETGEVSATTGVFSQTKYDEYMTSQQQSAAQARDQAMSEMAQSLGPSNDSDNALAIEEAGKKAYEDYMRGAQQKAEEMKASGEFNDIVSLEPTGESSNNLSDSLKEATDAAENLLNTRISDYANEVGMSAEEFQALAESIAEVNGDTRQLKDMTEAEQQSLLSLTATAKKAANAWDDLTSKQKSNISMVKNGEKANLNYASGLESIINDLSDIFGNNKAITADFVENNIETIEKMANGVDGAAEDVEEAVLRAQAALDGWDYDKEIKVKVDIDEDGVADQLDSIGELINNFGDQYSNEPIGFTVDNTAALAAMTEVLNSGEMTAEQIQEAFNSVGWDPQVEWDEYTLTEQDVGRGYVEAPVLDPVTGDVTGYQNLPITSDYSAGQTIMIPHIKGGEGGTFKKTGGGASSGVSPTSSSGGGGGGGGSNNKTTKDHKKYDDEIERYHVIENHLDNMAKLLEKIDKLKSRTYGQAHLDDLDAEINAMRQEIGLQQQYLAEAEDYLASDKARMQALGATFSADGTITNYEQLMQQWIDEYNAAVDTYNNSEQEDADDDALEDAEDLYEDRIDWLEKYEESLSKVQEKENEILELQNKISAALLEKITYKVNLVVELNTSDLKVMDYFIAKMTNILHMQDEMYDTMIKKSSEYEHNLATYAEAITELERQHQIFLDTEGEDGINDNDYATQLQEYRDSITDTLSTLNTLRENIKNVYGTTLTKANEEISKHTKIIDHAKTVAQEYVEILGLMGHAIDYDDLEQFYDMQYTAGLNNLKVQREWLDTLEKEIEYYQRRMDAGHQLTETEKQQWNDLIDQYTTAHETFLSTTKTTLQDIQTAYDAHIQAILKQLSEVNVAGHNNLQDVSDAYTRWNEQQGLYLATGKQLYEVSKLNREIEGSIEDATTKASKARLKALQEVINKQAESGKLTEYQIQMYDLQYKMALAMQELEEAQNAKSTVRLTRDENGNYGYQYTADQDAIDSAEQNYEDVLEQIRSLTAEHADQMAQAYIDARQRMEQELAALNRSEFETEEEYYHARDEIIAHYTSLMDYYAGEYELAVGDLTTNLGYIGEHYGLSQQEISEMTTAALNTDIQTMIDNQDEYTQALNDALNEMDAAWDEYMAQVDEVTETTGIDYDTMTASIDKYNHMMDQSVEKSKEVISSLGETLENIHKTTEEWDKHSQMVDTVIEKYEALIEKLGETLSALQNLAAGYSSANTSYSTTSPTYSSGSNPSGGSNTNSGSNPSGGSNTGSDSPSSPTANTVWAYDATHHWRVNQSTNSQVGNKEAHKYNSPITNISKCTVCGRQLSHYTPGSPSSTPSTPSTPTQGCFVAGTEIMMADGTNKLIEDIQINDLVMSYNVETGTFEARPVIKLFNRTGYFNLMRVTLNDNTTLELTTSHPILTMRGWKSRDLVFSMLEEHVQAKWLEEDDIVIKYEANVQISLIEELFMPAELTVYNFKVDNTHTYIANGVIVHNMNDKYAEGGIVDYTGPAWVDGTPQKPELMLNPDDTQRMIQAVSIIRSMSPDILSQLNGNVSNLLTTNIGATGVTQPQAQSLEQMVTITAEFPNATDHNEIELAFADLINQTSQYINRK